MAVRYLPAAREDIKSAIKWSVQDFGAFAAHRYKRLLGVAISELEANPQLTHSYELRELQAGVRISHLKPSRNRAVVDGQIVKRPRLFILYKVIANDQLVIIRVLHERMEVLPGLEKE